jgi:hypothetical protein
LFMFRSLSRAGTGRFPKLLAGFENCIGGFWKG